MSAAIYLLDRSCEVWRWLCDKHVAQAKRNGWTVKQKKTPPHELPCDECPREY